MTEAANKSKVARIQFRLTDGSSVVNSFEPEQTLDDARMFITNKLKEMNESTSFTIHSTFPKRDYTTSDMSLTLRELQLVPSASLLIIPTSSKTVKALSTLLPSTSSVRNSGGSNSTTSTIVTYATDLLGFMFLPFTIIWGIVSNVLGLNSPHSNRRYENHTNSRQNESVDFEDQNSRRKNFRNGEDDDNATYNGNSTQQM